MADGVDVRGNSIRITFTLDGKQQRQTMLVNGEPMKPTAPNLRFAQRLAVEIKRKIKLGVFSMAETFPGSGAGGVLTVAQQLRTWMDGQRVTPSTRRGYESAVKFWSSRIGEVALRALKVSQIQKAIAGQPDWSGKTVNNKTDVLSAALDLAVLDGLLSENPAKHIKRASYQKPEPDPYTLEEAELILAWMKPRYDPQVYNYVEWKFFSGVRTGESLGLRWPNVDWVGKKMMVSEQVVERQHSASTKTSVSRLVTLNSRALAALQRQKAHTFVEGNYVFHDPRHNKGWVCENAFLKGYWLRAIKAVGVRYRPPYNTRHTYATMFLMSGAKPAYIAKQMGHSLDVLLSRYARWVDGGRDDAEQARLEEFIGFIPTLSPEKFKTL